MQKILIIDDDSSVRKTLQLHLRESGREIETAGDLTEAERLWRTVKPDIVLLDLNLPDGDGLSLYEHSISSDLGGLVILITGETDMERATEAMRMGAYDYLMKPLDIDQLEAVMERALALENISAKRSVDISDEQDYKPGKIVGRSKAILELHKTIGLASRSFANVIIRGETGTGKELVAKAIHRNSCPEAPFIAVNCSAIVATLLESELFGHEKGAFTGAVSTKPGQLELAREGVIFLDEIGDMAMDLQVKLLRVLQEREYKRVGGSNIIQLKARIIAATHQNLEEMVEKGEFREDLYYRLKVIEIDIPPLRKRREDIPVIAKTLLKRINSEVHRNISAVPEVVMEQLKEYDWPGNVRELENLLTTAVVRSPGQTLELDMPMKRVKQAGVVAVENWNRPMEEVEKEHIQSVLNNVNGHFGRACDILGISRPTLRKKIKDYDLKASFNDD